MSLLRYLQIAFTAKTRCFRFPRKESCYSPASATSLATVLASPCFCTGAVDPVRLPAQLFAAEPMQSPHADVLSISSMNAHLELCPFSPAFANLQGAREQTLPGEKKSVFTVVRHTRGSVTGSSGRNPHCHGASQAAIPTAPPRSGGWATTAEQTSLQGMQFLALSLLIQQVS